MKCLNCKKKSKYLWCSMECKKQHYLHNYSYDQIQMWEKERKKLWNKNHKIELKKWKDSGIKSYVEYLRSLGPFKK